MQKSYLNAVIISDRFSKHAMPLRRHFEQRFSNARDVKADRFVWDYWHIEDQYTALRTPAYEFFPKEIYEAFHNQLVWWGRTQLGCHDVSPPWLSCYVDGCFQDLHGDLPHGPWSYVFSLTPWQNRKFKGGETILLREEILDYWHGFESVRGLERDDVVREVPARFNRLVVFDPRIPHGVKRVSGVSDLNEARLVIHGWFVQPRPFIQGPLKTSSLQKQIDHLSENLNQLFADGLEVFGAASFSFKVLKSGRVTQTQTLSSSLRNPGRDSRVARALLKHINLEISKMRFSSARTDSSVTLPLIFEV